MRLGTAIECLVDNYKYASDKEWINDKVAWALYHTWKEADRKTENSSEKPNNCEHITEDGVTCAKYPACDDCLDNPLNKVKGSERLVKGSEQTEPTISKMEQVDKDINVPSKDEPHIVGKHADVVIIDDSRLTAKCLNCNNSKACKEKHWDGCVYEPIEDDPKVVMPKECKGCDSASKIIEAYSKGFEDGAEAVKKMPQTEYERASEQREHDILYEPTYDLDNGSM